MYRKFLATMMATALAAITANAAPLGRDYSGFDEDTTAVVYGTGGTTNAAYFYGFEVDPTSTSVDLDGVPDGSAGDFHPLNAPDFDLVNGMATNGTGGAEALLRTDFGNSLWRQQFLDLSSYTVEIKLNVKATDGEGSNGVFGMLGRNSIGGHEVYIGTNTVKASGATIDSSMDNTGWHVWRVEVVGSEYFVYRDGVQVGGSNALIGSWDRSFLGDFSGSLTGDWDLEYVVMDTLQLAPPPATISSFTASSTSVKAGEDVTLEWTTADEDTLTLLPGIGDVTGTTSNIVTITTNITYTLIASNAYGTATDTVDIIVLPNRPWEDDLSLIGTTNGTVESGINDADNASDIRGQSIVVNAGATTNDAAIPQTVVLKQLSFQARSPGDTIGSDTVYIHVYDAFEVNSALAVTNVGNLIAVSTNTVDLSAASNLDELTWYFNEDEVDKATEYFYVLATNTTAATSLDVSNLAVGGFEVITGDPYAAGKLLHSEDAAGGWDLEFELITTGGSTAAPVTDLEISGPISGGTAMVLSWTSENNKPYGVETNDNLVASGNWDTFVTGLMGNGGTLSVTNTIGPDETFYRVISE